MKDFKTHEFGKDIPKSKTWNARVKSLNRRCERCKELIGLEEGSARLYHKKCRIEKVKEEKALAWRNRNMEETDA